MRDIFLHLFVGCIAAMLAQFSFAETINPNDGMVAAALDTTHDDDFWNTSAYVNTTPDIAAATGSMADTRISSERESNTLETFRSTPKGLRIILF